MVDVKLIAKTSNPVETIWLIWMASKEKNFDPNDHCDQGEKNELVGKLINMDVPVIENVSFTFLIKGVSVSWREQAVRHRVGTKVGDRVGIDIIPQEHESTYWSTSMRIMDMSGFYDDEGFRTPDSIMGNESAREIYNIAMKTVQDTYRVLVTNYGIPFEDARELIPLGATHTITWTLNLKALKHIISKRACFILQSSLWHPVINGMVDALKYDGEFLIAENLVEPPCVTGGKFKECAYEEENRRRLAGSDSLPVCPMYLYHNLITGLNSDDLNAMTVTELIEALINAAVTHTDLSSNGIKEEMFVEKMREDLLRFSDFWTTLIYQR